MALPASGPLTMAQINAEFGRGNNLNAYRGTTYYTSSGGPFTFPTGAISFSNFYGTQVNSPLFSFTIASNQANANLRSLAIAAGWSGSGAVTATINAGVYIYSNTVGTPALTINGSWPGGVTLINNGLIMGQGGQGGGYYQYVAPGGTITNTQSYLQTAGSAAISLGVSCTIQNNSYIAGGGGGGGNNNAYLGGGGAGGGAGGAYRTRNENVSPVTDTTTPGGAGGGLGGSGSAGTNTPSNTGGGGGRILPGSNTTLTATSSGGSPNATSSSTGGGANNAGSATGTSGTGSTFSSQVFPGAGGSGGGTGVVYAGIGSYALGGQAGGGGGGWGASGGTGIGNGTPVANVGSAGGNCVLLNGFTATFTATGTRYGAIS